MKILLGIALNSAEITQTRWLKLLSHGLLVVASVAFFSASALACEGEGDEEETGVCAEEEMEEVIVIGYADDDNYGDDGQDEGDYESPSYGDDEDEDGSDSSGSNGGAGQMEETFTYGIRPDTWSWDISYWIYDLTTANSIPYGYVGVPYYPEMRACTEEDFTCMHMMTNCSSDIDTRREYALHPINIGTTGIGQSFWVTYPGFPGTHNEKWTVQYRVGTVVGLYSEYGCLDP